MADHELLLPLAPAADAGKPGFRTVPTHLELSVSYYKGDGICLSLLPITIEERTLDGIVYQSRLSALGGSVCTVVEPASRLNRKRVKAVAADVWADAVAKRGRVWELVQLALQKCGRTIAEDW